MKERNRDKKDSKKRELELYFHIPFCVRKCLYCDFLSAPADGETIGRYMEALLAETEGSALSYQDYTVTSVFIGGGTPSVVPVEHLERLMAAVRGRYRLAQNAEITIEVNPGTVTEDSLYRFRAAGINRLSIGLQSADDRELVSLGRIHNWEQFVRAFSDARRAGFGNINVDVMSALPGQTLDKYLHTLEKVLALEEPPEHISAYSLILEEGTPFFERVEKGRLEIPDEDTDREMYLATREILARKGYRRYEISNYAKEGYECRHNCGYWQRKNYVGFGIGAASLVENVRFHNGVDLQAYMADSLSCREEIQVLSRQEQMEEFMFLGLRMTEGVDCEEFERLFGCDIEDMYGDTIEKNIRDGLLRIDSGAAGKEGESEQSGCERQKESGQSGCEGQEEPGQNGCEGQEEPGQNGCEGQEEPGQNGCEGENNRDREKVYEKNAAPSVQGRLALTEKGLDLSNYVMAQFLFS